MKKNIVLALLNGKKRPKNNLVVGLNVNLSFVKRVKVTYDTAFSELITTPRCPFFYG